MQFKHPELLYALFLLLIPILIHLFQLRRFQKVDFTNVAFLKKVTLQTRKSSQLKKWLLLTVRLLLFASIILAFAQPFTATKTALNTQKETVLYLDNSYSMQAKGPRGELLQTAIQDLYKNLKGNQKINWFTNDTEYKNQSINSAKEALLRLEYSYTQRSIDDVYLKALQLFSKNEASDKQLIIVSDFQQQTELKNEKDAIKISTVRLSPENTENINIDSVYIASKNNQTTTLKVLVSTQSNTIQTVPVSLYNETTLIAKTAANFTNAQQNTVSFTIDNSSAFKGRISLEDASLQYDNTLFFSINDPTKIKVLSINNTNANYLQRLFSGTEFNYTSQQHNSLDYSSIPEQHFIILNELDTLPLSLTNALKAFVQKGGCIFIIPSNDAEIASYNTLLAAVQLPLLSNKVDQEKKISNIQFNHPIYKNVFEKEVVNFQYPKVNSYYPVSNSAASNVLGFEDEKPFILNTDLAFLSTAPLSNQNSNFKNSPLIVPTIYNMAQLSLPLPELYYTIGEVNTFSVPTKLSKDEIITIKDSLTSFIPLQQTKEQQVLITTTNNPKKAGNYAIVNDEAYLKEISYNYDRSESILQYANVDNWENVQAYNSIDEVFSSIEEANKINSFWKWFAIFALVLLITELLILKFYK